MSFGIEINCPPWLVAFFGGSLLIPLLYGNIANDWGLLHDVCYGWCIAVLAAIVTLSTYQTIQEHTRGEKDEE